MPGIRSACYGTLFLYVAATRAREHLLLTGLTPGSEYRADFVGGSSG
jgi:hypothetical protein